MVGKAISVGREVLAGVGFNGKHGSAQQENRVCATITPTTPSGSGLLAASTALCSSMQFHLCVFVGIGARWELGACPTAAISAHPSRCAQGLQWGGHTETFSLSCTNLHFALQLHVEPHCCV